MSATSSQRSSAPTGLLVLQAEEDGQERRWVSLAELEQQLPYDRSEADAALQRLLNDNACDVVHVVPEARLPETLTDVDRAGVERFDDHVRRLLMIER